MFEIRRLESLESNPDFEKQEICCEEPLTLTLSRRERGLTALDVRDTPT